MVNIFLKAILNLMVIGDIKARASYMSLTTLSTLKDIRKLRSRVVMLSLVRRMIVLLHLNLNLKFENEFISSSIQSKI